MASVPFDSEACDSGLFSQNIPPDTIDVRLSRRFGVQLLRIIFIVHIVSHADKFTIVVRACKQDNCHAEDFGGRNLGEIGWIGLENEFVHADGNGSDEE